MRYTVSDDMPDGAVVHITGSTVRLNARHEDLWEAACERAGLDFTRCALVPDQRVKAARAS